MKTFPHLTLCPHCDSVYPNLPRAPGETARCHRCYAVLWRGEGRVPAHVLPLTLTAAITLVMACIFPVMSVGFHGMVNDVTLWNAAWVLAAAPFLQVTLTAWLLGFARFSRPAPGFIFTMKALKWLHPWSRVEVGVLGFLVAGIKLSSLLDVSVGPGGWALGVSCVLILLVNSHDLHPLWSLLSVGENDHRD